MQKKLICYFLFSILAMQLSAQDPFFTHFYSTRSAFNPALVGYSGALSLYTKYKSQWAAGGQPAFRSGWLSLEQGLPCSLFDLGLAFRFDQEGALRTLDLGGQLAFTIPLSGQGRGIKNLHNLRVGMNLQVSQKYADYSQLLFSDELDPKYGTRDPFGNDLPTSFVPPNDGRSSLFFTPVIGAVYNGILQHKSPKPTNILLGVSVHNGYSLGNFSTGHLESVLGLDARIPPRWTAFAQFNPIFYNKQGIFFALQPTLLYQRQGAISYMEISLRLGLNRLMGLGLGYHSTGQILPGRNTNWFSLSLELGEVLTDKTRVDLGFSYSTNFTGLRNWVGPILEFSAAFHFATRSACNNVLDCTNWTVNRRRNKIYENIWYKTIHNQGR